jgi:hypothetical protein
MKNLATLSILLFALISFALATPLSALAAAGPPSGGLYADNNVFQTVGTPTSLPHSHGQPFDQLYRFVSALPPGAPATDQQYPLSDFGPGDQGFVGGRWHVVLVVDSDGNPITGYDFAAHPITSLSQYQALKAAMGWTEISTSVYFECPLLPVH